MAQIHRYFKEGRPLVDGYAPFCKHLFVPNFCGAAVQNLEITDQNRHGKVSNLWLGLDDNSGSGPPVLLGCYAMGLGCHGAARALGSGAAGLQHSCSMKRGSRAGTLAESGRM